MFRPDLEHPALNDVIDLYRGLNLLPVPYGLQVSFITEGKRAPPAQLVQLLWCAHLTPGSPR